MVYGRKIHHLNCHPTASVSVRYRDWFVELPPVLFREQSPVPAWYGRHFWYQYRHNLQWKDKQHWSYQVPPPGRQKEFPGAYGGRMLAFLRRLLGRLYHFRREKPGVVCRDYLKIVPTSRLFSAVHNRDEDPVSFFPVTRSESPRSAVQKELPC